MNRKDNFCGRANKGVFFSHHVFFKKLYSVEKKIHDKPEKGTTTHFLLFGPNERCQGQKGGHRTRVLDNHRRRRNDNSLSFFPLSLLLYIVDAKKQREGSQKKSRSNFFFHADREPSGATNGAVIIHL